MPVLYGGVPGSSSLSAGQRADGHGGEPGVPREGGDDVQRCGIIAGDGNGNAVPTSMRVAVKHFHDGARTRPSLSIAEQVLQLREDRPVRAPVARFGEERRADVRSLLAVIVVPGEERRAGIRAVRRQHVDRPGLIQAVELRDVAGQDPIAELIWARRSKSRPVRRSESTPPEGGSFYAFCARRAALPVGPLSDLFRVVVVRQREPAEPARAPRVPRGGRLRGARGRLDGVMSARLGPAASACDSSSLSW